MVLLAQGLTIFWSSLLSASPFLGLGILCSSAIQIWGLPLAFIKRWPRNPLLAAGCGGGLGLILPIGPYGQIPVARGLSLAGLPIASVVSYAIAASSLNLWVIGFMFFQFSNGLELVGLRGSLVYVTSLGIGALFGWLARSPKVSAEKDAAIAPRPFVRSWGEDIDRLKTLPPKKLNRFLQTLLQETKIYGLALVLCCGIMTLLQLQISVYQFPLNQGTFAPLLMAPLFSLGSWGDTQLGSTLLNLMPLKMMLPFWLMGTIVDLKSLGLLLVAFRLKLVLYLVLLLTQISGLALLLFFFQSA